MCLGASRALLVSGKKSALQGFTAVMPFCAAASVELSLEEYLSLNICLKSADTSFPV